VRRRLVTNRADQKPQAIVAAARSNNSKLSRARLIDHDRIARWLRVPHAAQYLQLPRLAARRTLRRTANDLRYSIAHAPINVLLNR
jgi:hypothetical protein